MGRPIPMFDFYTGSLPILSVSSIKRVLTFGEASRDSDDDSAISN